MRSSDQRYYQVQRAKRTPEQWTRDTVYALQTARLEGDYEALNRVVRDSADEYPVVLLACGRTANDFRRQFRRGPAGYHVVAANSIAPMDTLLDERLDGYAVMRLSREQHRAVKDKAEKLYKRDRLISDPQGDIWREVLQASLAGQRGEHIDLLLNLRERGRALNEQDRAGYQISAHPRPDELPDNLPSNDAVLPFAAAQYQRYRGMVDVVRWTQWRALMTTPVRMLTAYLDGGSMMVARYCRGEDTKGHEHRRHFQARVDRIDAELGDRLDLWAAAWDGLRPEQLPRSFPGEVAT